MMPLSAYTTEELEIYCRVTKHNSDVAKKKELKISEEEWREYLLDHAEEISSKHWGEE
tara:strand:+ start:557 stop:730 length:174 start_codon:yes stop_codon:yes gene_type:complete